MPASTKFLLTEPLSLLSRIRDRLDPGARAAPDPVHSDRLRLVLPWTFRQRGGRTEIVSGPQDADRPDPVLIKGLRTAHALLDSAPGNRPTLDAAPATPWRRRLIRLAFLAPDIQQAILAGRHSEHLSLATLMNSDIPLLWSEQRRRFGPEIPNQTGR